MSLTVLAVASEAFPLVKTGGLGDVAGALPAALAAEGVRVVTLLPGYPAVMAALEASGNRTAASGAAAVQRPAEVAAYAGFFGGSARVISGLAAGLDLIVLDAPHLYARAGGIYADATGADWPDNGLRFAALAWAAADIARRQPAGFAPDLVHAHDWQAGLAPAYLHFGGGPPSVLTVHNIGYPGRFPAGIMPSLRLPTDAYSIDGVEYFGGVGFLKAGLRLADRITTVSPTHAEEIATEEGGMGLGGLVRARGADVSGILNGIDISVWNPATDPLIARRYTARTLRSRQENRAALRRRFGLGDDGDRPVVGVVSRLTWQKGLDLLLDVLPDLIGLGGRLALVGSGDERLAAGFQAAVAQHAGDVGVIIGYDESLAHAVQAGADMVLVPSRYEPCGLTQLAALRYGAVPVVARVGGLADTVVDATPMTRAAGAATGFQFAPVTAERLLATLRRAIAAFADREGWRALQRAGMATDVSWNSAARAYAALFRTVAGGAA